MAHAPYDGYGGLMGIVFISGYRRRLLVGLVGLCLWWFKPSVVAAQPNVLMIVLDDQNTWIEPMGEYPDVITPQMNRLADSGVTFLNAHCQAPVCSPSRISFLTGLRPSTTGLYGLNTRRGTHPVYGNGMHKTLHESFHDAGYTTASAGKVFHSSSDLAAIDVVGPGGSHGPFPPAKFTDPGLTGSNTFIDWGAYPADDSLMPDYEVVTWATNQMNSFAGGTSPFLMTIGLHRPHVPLFVPQHWFDLYPPGSFALPYYEPNDLDDTPRFARYTHWMLPEPRTEALLAYHEWENHTRAYLACVSFVDAQIGRLLDALEATGRAGNTIVVLLSDHGYHLGEKGLTAKTTLWDESTRVPLLMTGPGIAPGESSAQAVELLDLYPTLLDLCGLPPYAPLEGRSLRPQLEDPASAPPRPPAITTHGIDNHSVVNARFRYIRYADGTEEFYDRFIDPDEQINRIHHPNYREAAVALASWLPANRAARVGPATRLVEIGADDVVRWEGNPIYDPEAGEGAGTLDDAWWLWSRNITPAPFNAFGDESAWFRRTFTVVDPADVEQAVLTATADNTLVFWINGIFIFSNSAWRETTVLDLTPHLQPGVNVMAAIATNFGPDPNPAGFVATLRIRRTTGADEIIVTDATWKSAQSMNDSGWSGTAYNDSDWCAAAPLILYDNGPWAGQTGGGLAAIGRETLATPVTDEALTDEDGDLLPDWWERHYTGSTNVLHGLDNDYDLDGVTDVMEYRMGTDPTDPTDVMRLNLSAPDPGIPEIALPTRPGRDYRLDVTGNLVLSNGWSETGPWIYGDGSRHTFPAPPTDQGFFRGVIRRAE